MASSEVRLILASGSPRRRELLGKFSIPFEILPAVGEEEPPLDRSPGDYVLALAEQKAAQVCARAGDPAAVIVAADTVVELDGRILGKPRDGEDAARMLRALSGTVHRVWTGVCVRRGDTVRSCAESVEMHFRELTQEEILSYVATGEPLDKAGSYGYQERASIFVQEIRGDFYTAVGLPMCRLSQLLREFGIELM